MALRLSLVDSLWWFHVKSLFDMRLLHYHRIATRGSPFRHTDSPRRNRRLEIAEPGSAKTDTSPDSEKAGRFRRVEPMPGTVVVNVGYLLMRWSNGRWKNTVHRVVEPPKLKNDKDEEVTLARYSVPFFASPAPEAVVEALSGCWNEEVPKRWQAINAGEYLRRKRKSVFV